MGRQRRLRARLQRLLLGDGRPRLLYSYYSDGYGNVDGAVYVDDCLLADYGAGPHDRQRVIDHEMGHARGLPDSSDPSSYMYAYYTVTGT